MSNWRSWWRSEDALHGLAIGSVIPVHTSAEAEPISAKLVEMRDWGEFAVWRAARATGDHDLNTFFIRLDPVVLMRNLAAGQTVWLSPVINAK